jgi:hypothetical protein
MTDDELVAKIEATRDDPEAWGDATPSSKRKPKSEQRQRGAMVSVRFSPAELASVQAQADGAGASVSGYIRELVLKAARQPVLSAIWAGSVTVNSPGTFEGLIVREESSCSL